MSPISPLLNVNGSICGCPQVPASRLTWCCHACSSLAKGSCPWEFSLTKGCPWGFSSAGTWQLTSSVSRHPRQRWRRKKKVEVEATFRTKLPSSDGNYQMLYSASYFFGNYQMLYWAFYFFRLKKVILLKKSTHYGRKSDCTNWLAAIGNNRLVYNYFSIM